MVNHMTFNSIKKLTISALTVVPLMFAPAIHAYGYSYTTLDDPNILSGNPYTNQTWATGINNSGQVVGWFGNQATFQGFIYNGSTYNTINVDTSINSGWPTQGYATGINNKGFITGNYLNVNGGVSGFIFNGSVFTPINDPYAMYPQTHTLGINDNGNVAGYFYDNSNINSISSGQNGPYFGYNGFVYDGNTFTSIDDPKATTGSYATGVNNSEYVTGYFGDAQGIHGFLYKPGVFVPNTGDVGLFGGGLPGGGFFTYPTYTTLDDPNATSGTYATGINNNGLITGYYIDSLGSHGFIYNGSTYTTIDDPFGVIGTTKAISINDSGQIVGQFNDVTGYTHSFIASQTAVPIPGAFWMFLTSVVGLIELKRRNQ